MICLSLRSIIQYCKSRSTWDLNPWDQKPESEGIMGSRIWGLSMVRYTLYWLGKHHRKRPNNEKENQERDEAMGDGGNRIRGGDEMRIVGRDCEESSNACESYGLYTTCEEDIYQVTRYELYGAKKKKEKSGRIQTRENHRNIVTAYSHLRRKRETEGMAGEDRKVGIRILWVWVYRDRNPCRFRVYTGRVLG